MDPGAIVRIDDIPNRPGMVRVRGTRRTLATLTRAGAEALALTPGTRWTESLAARVCAREAMERAVTVAARLLKVRARSRVELRERLLTKGHSEPAVEAALDSLARSGLVNDAEFARQVVKAATRRAPMGEALLQERLKQRGVQTPDARPALNDAKPDREEVLRFARGRLRAMPAKLDDAARRRRLAGALARRGFDEETVERVLASVLGEGQGEE